MNSGHLLKKALDTFHEDGFRGVLLKSLDWAGIYRRVYLLQRDFDESFVVRPQIPVHVRPLETNDIDALIRFHPGIERSEIRERLDRGDLCFLLLGSDAILAYSWNAIQHAYIAYLDCYIRLNSGLVYGYDLYVHPEHRGKRLAASLSFLKYRYLHRIGFSQRIAVVLPENRSAIRHMRRMGHRKLGIAGYVGFGTWRKYFIRPEPGNTDLRRIRLSSGKEFAPRAAPAAGETP